MKPLKLIIRAFGPFSKEQVLDFRELGNRSFFLIHGPTGSGKTTILDAMCYALYGDTSGAERSGDQMRCGFAEPDTLTEVAFDFSVGEKVYRVWRRPEQDRPKKRGGGLTKEPAGAELFQCADSENTGEGTPLAAGWMKVTQEVEGLLGFRSDQFRQVVMVPQGKFRQLLIADSKERQDILKVLFNTERYGRIQEFIKQKSKELQDLIREKEKEKILLMNEAGVSSLEELDKKIKETAAALESMKRELAEKQTLFQHAQQSFLTGKSVKEKLDELENAEKSLNILDKQKTHFDQLKRELKEARHAAMLIPAERSLVQNRKQWEEAEKELQIWETNLRTAKEVLRKTEACFTEEKAREKEREEAAEKLIFLRELVPKIAALEEAKRKLEKDQAEERSCRETKTKAEHELDKLNRFLETKKEALSLAQKQEAVLGLLEKEHQELADKYRIKIQLGKLQFLLNNEKKDLEKSANEAARINLRYSQLKDEYYRLQEAWSSGQAAVLAKTLRKDHPCPVCGSLYHPAPAASVENIPSEDEMNRKKAGLEKAEKESRSAEAKQNEVGSKISRLEGQVLQLKETLGDAAEISTALLGVRVKEAQVKLADARQIVSGIKVLGKEAEAITQKQVELENELAEREKRQKDAVTVLTAVEAAVKEKAAGIPEEYQNNNALARAIKNAEQEKNLLNALYENAREKFGKAEKNLAAAQVRLDASIDKKEKAEKNFCQEEVGFKEELNKSGFADTSAFNSAKRNEKEMVLLEKSIKDFEGALHAAWDRLERARKESAGLKVPNLDKLEKELIDAQNVKEKIIADEARLMGALISMEGWHLRLSEIIAELNKKESRYRVVGRLSDAANGKNGLGMTFQIFVLGALLDDVTLAANERLKIMSRGRYYLQRTQKRERANALGGLEIEVFDNYTGIARPLVTLSGGESFLASLSLALGLAEVVQTYAGGIHLDTIFIDEGFGSLDPDALDFSIRILIDLQKDGRLVGIISHIPELKERIDARLEVKAGERGSTARFMAG